MLNNYKVSLYYCKYKKIYEFIMMIIGVVSIVYEVKKEGGKK